MNVVGLDLSLTATGIADATTDTVKSRLRGPARLVALRNRIVEACAGADLVVIEDYAFSRANAHSHELGELGGVVRVALHEAGVTFVPVGPSALKKFATGKGNAQKDAVLAAAVRAGFDGDDNNAADAWWLRQIGLYRHDKADVASTVYRDEAVAKIVWPVVSGAAA